VLLVLKRKEKGKKVLGFGVLNWGVHNNTYLISKSNCQMKSYDVKNVFLLVSVDCCVVREKKHRHNKLEPNGKSDSHPLIIHPSRCH